MFYPIVLSYDELKAWSFGENVAAAFAVRISVFTKLNIIMKEYNKLSEAQKQRGAQTALKAVFEQKDIPSMSRQQISILLKIHELLGHAMFRFVEKEYSLNLEWVEEPTEIKHIELLNQHSFTQGDIKTCILVLAHSIRANCKYPDLGDFIVHCYCEGLKMSKRKDKKKLRVYINFNQNKQKQNFFQRWYDLGHLIFFFLEMAELPLYQCYTSFNAQPWPSQLRSTIHVALFTNTHNEWKLHGSNGSGKPSISDR